MSSTSATSAAQSPAAHGAAAQSSAAQSPAAYPTTAIPTAPAADAALSARALSKSYGTTIALAGVDLDIRRGEAVAIMGASGSGKTTLLHCLAGIVVPDSGAVLLGAGTAPGHPGHQGHPEQQGPASAASVAVHSLPDAERSRLRRERFGFVFQQGLLIPELTAIENVAIALMLRGTSRADAELHAASWLAHLGLAGMERRRIGELSGGQAQRVAIARAQVTGAEVVFADEPTGALDSATSADVMTTLLASTIGRGASLVLVTHDPGVAARCTRTVTLVDGRIVGDTAASQRTTTPRTTTPPTTTTDAGTRA